MNRTRTHWARSAMLLYCGMRRYSFERRSCPGACRSAANVVTWAHTGPACSDNHVGPLSRSRHNRGTDRQQWTSRHDHLQLTGFGAAENKDTLTHWIEQAIFQPAHRDGQPVPGLYRTKLEARVVRRPP
jgi:hypothetical protein